MFERKQTHQLFAYNNSKKSNKLLAVLHSDLVDSIKVPLRCQHRYIFTTWMTIHHFCVELLGITDIL